MRPAPRVYFIQSGGPDGYIKIGYGDPFRRLVELQTSSPYPLKLLHDFVGGPKEEREMHMRFYHLHVRGEWFKPDDELLKLCGLKIEREEKRPIRRRRKFVLPPLSEERVEPFHYISKMAYLDEVAHGPPEGLERQSKQIRKMHADWFARSAAEHGAAST